MMFGSDQQKMFSVDFCGAATRTDMRASIHIYKYCVYIYTVYLYNYIIYIYTVYTYVIIDCLLNKLAQTAHTELTTSKSYTFLIPCSKAPQHVSFI